MATVNGTNGNDNLVGTPLADTLRGRGGDDTLTGLGGDDRIIGNGGNDLIIWNDGDDSDRISGRRGNDTVQINGDPNVGDDFIITDDGNKQVTVQRVEGTQSPIGIVDDVLGGGTEPFSLDIDGIERLEINGFGGNETFTTDMSIDDQIKQVYNAGQGIDTIDLSNLDTGVFVDTDLNSRGFAGLPDQQGFVRFASDFDPDVDGAAVVNSPDPLPPQIDINDFEGIIGTDFDDILFGGQENDTIFGGAGDDAVHPFAGVNFIDGEEGTDTLLLNALPVGVLTDLVTGVAGNNVINGIENVQGSDVGGDIINGDSLANLLDGNGGSDTLRGGRGRDTLLGEDGNDILFGGRGADSLSGGAGTDIIEGGGGRDTISGAENTSGLDQLSGGGGRDTFILGDGINTAQVQILDFQPGRDIITLPGDLDVNLQPAVGGTDIIVEGSTAVATVLGLDPTQLVLTAADGLDILIT